MKQLTVGSFVLLQLYFTMCDGLNTAYTSSADYWWP